MPTETVYGLAGMAFDEQALASIFAAKERPTFDPLIVHIPQPGQGREVANWGELLVDQKLLDLAVLSSTARERLHKLAARFWPGPLTLVVPKQPAVPDLATSGLPTVAIRMPRHPVAQALLAQVGQPLAAPSANRFGRISPTSAEDVRAELEGRIELILDGGRCEVGLESTVLALAANGALTLLRPGGIALAEIEQTVGVAPQSAAATTNDAAQPAPGMLKSHYAPAKTLRLLPAPVAELGPQHAAQLEKLTGRHRYLGVLLLSGEAEAAERKLRALLPADCSLAVCSLSPSGDAPEAARGLFAALRRLDADPAVELILAEPVTQPVGLLHAIADRLQRASAE